MKNANEFTYPFLAEFLSPSLFSILPLMEGFNDTKALLVVETLKQHVNQSKFKDDEISLILRNKLIESIGRNVGQGENHGSGFPFDLMERLKNNLEFDINEGLIEDVMAWGNSPINYEFVTLINDKQEEYYFQTKDKPLELVPYTKVANLSYEILEKAFEDEFAKLEMFILTEIPADVWENILSKDEKIEKYLQ